MAEDTKAPEKGFVVININKDKHSGPVRGGVNGRTYEVKVGSDQTVPAWVARSLSDSQIEYTLVAGSLDNGEGGAEGSAPSSTAASETGTAIRGDTPDLDGVAGTPMAASKLSATPPEIGQVGGAQSDTSKPANASGSTQEPVEGNDDDDLVAGNVTDVVGGINADTNLDELEAAENDREKPRKGVLSAIEAERSRRAE